MSSLEQTASWVIREKHTGRAVFETFDSGCLEVVKDTKFEAVPILLYLQELNRKIKQEASQ